MSDEQLPRGIDRAGTKFRARAGSGKNRVSKVCDTLEEAIAYRTGARAELAAGATRDGYTLEEWGRVWLPRRRGSSSYANDRGRWAKHVLPTFGTRPLSCVTRGHVRAWLRHLQAKGLSASTIRNCRSLLSVAYEDAIDDELVDANPCAGVKVKVKLPPISDDWYLYPDEQAALIAAAGDEVLRAMLGVALGAGLRRGELFTLHVRDVHLEGDPHLVVRYGGWAKGGALRPPKNGKARRVALFGLALESLTAWLPSLTRAAPTNPHGLVFPTSSGARRVYSRDLPVAWKTARRAVTRIKPWWHLLRHTCASSLIAGWWGPAWTLEEVSKFLGHSSIAVTERYAKLAPSALDEKARAMPLVTVVTDEGGNVSRLLKKVQSRPGDLKLGPSGRNLGNSLPPDHPLTSAIEEVLRAAVAGEPTAVPRAFALLAELLPPAAAERLEVGS